MGIIVKLENKREKAEALPTPSDMYTSTLYATANHINEKGTIFWWLWNRQLLLLG